MFFYCILGCECIYIGTTVDDYSSRKIIDNELDPILLVFFLRRVQDKKSIKIGWLRDKQALWSRQQKLTQE